MHTYIQSCEVVRLKVPKKNNMKHELKFSDIFIVDFEHKI